MEKILRQFTTDTLFNATSALLSKLNIEFDRETADPIPVADFYDGPMPKYLTDALEYIEHTYFIGIANDQSLAGVRTEESTEETLRNSGKYDGMFIFACDARAETSLTRTAASALTRAFNHIASANPVILVIRQGNLLSLATCKRMNYKQEWRQGSGEKLGKVSILRNINCEHTHAGHIQILEQLASSTFRTFDELYKHWMKVFNSELLTKKFYNELFEWYQWAVDPKTKVSFPGDAETQNDDRENIDTRVIRLITRLMFVWFIKQKGLVPDCIFNKEYLKSILKDFNPQSERDANYYQAILQNLFFGTLNRAVLEDGEKREFAKASRSDVKNLYRYEELFSISEQEVVDMFSSVPFLNCGLFECQDKTKMLDGVSRRYYNDGFSRNAAKFADGTYRYRAVVPNVLFFHPEKGILSIFGRYVFTIEENTPQDMQVALDPELLGKVFENLLGAYNPETKETARNQSGSFYTPREIVQYMVNESLVAHLKRTVGEHLEQKYRELLDFSTEAVDLTEKEKKDILHSLFTCKILDPACGSGAFPMGMLQQMVHILQQVDPDNSQWREILTNMAVDESRRAFGIVDEEERKKKLLEIEETFNNGLNSPDYTRKLYIIESCIYGVDIQPIAMLITRLRFFITLICEQIDIKRDKPEENFGIKTLPNLESKFVAANSLIDADIHKYNEDWTQNEVLGILKDELMAIRRRHFYTRKRNEKMRLLREDEKKREQIHALINKLVGEPNQEVIAKHQNLIKDYEALMQNYQGEKWADETIQADLFSEPEVIRVDLNKKQRKYLQSKIDECNNVIQRELNKCTPQGFEAAVLQVTDWNPYDQNTVSPFLDMEWMFGVTDGFDIVIANPPYIRLQNNEGLLADLYKDCGYDSYDRTGDIYCLFYERAIDSLKESGVLCYITSNKWMRAGYGANIRRVINTESRPIRLIDFASVNVFDSATVDTNILLTVKEIVEKNEVLCTSFTKGAKKEIENLYYYVINNCVNYTFGESAPWIVLSKVGKSIREKIESVGTPLNKWDLRANRGIVTGYNNAFFIDDNKYNEILENCIDDEERNRTKSIIHPLLRGRDIFRYKCEWAKKWIIYIPWHFPNHMDNFDSASEVAEGNFKTLYPSVYSHLLSYKKQLSSRNKAETGKRYEWYALQRWGAKYWKDFFEPKIVWKIIGCNINFAIDNNGMVCNNAINIMTGNHDQMIQFVGLMNSKLFDWYLKISTEAEVQGGGIQLYVTTLEKTPLKLNFNEPFMQKVEKRIAGEISDNEMDEAVFDAYSLTQEEREFIISSEEVNRNNGEDDNDE